MKIIPLQFEALSSGHWFPLFINYFPDFIIEGEIVVEIKGYKNREKKINDAKIKAATNIFKNKYLFIEDVGQNLKAGMYYKLMKEKYGDRLVIKYNPHEGVNDTDS